jgi:hypothetical protein
MHLHRLNRWGEAVQVLERFARTENPLLVSHVLFDWHETLGQTKEAHGWLEYGVMRDEPEALLRTAG